ncbi:MAG: copper homeostasis protein CutC [Bacteroidales bacterium]|jgi:copper homeostasis protein|nr:copper homeostasis protein CutC [Bacteroidales bacterium]
MILEACVESVKEAILAEKRGANRLELCSRLDLDGLTPERELIEQVMYKVHIPVKVMIRPRACDFIYSTDELSAMKDDIRFCKQVGVQGVVFGALDKDDHLNLDQIQLLADEASPLEVTIHKAIDQTPDPLASLKELTKLSNITSVLTSGGAATAFDGKKIIKKMLQVSGGKIQIIAAGKITNVNLTEIHHLIGAHEYHGRKIAGILNELNY